jgi:hypothetical protein
MLDNKHCIHCVNTGSTWGQNWMCNNAKCYVVWQTAVCGLSVGFHCGRYWLLLYSLHSYYNSTQNHVLYYKFIARQCTLYTLYANVAVIKLPIFPQPYNIEGLETSHRCPSHSFLLQRGVCVTVQSVCVHTVVCTWTEGWLCISSCTDPWLPCVTACNTFAFHFDTNRVHSSALQ